jgi:CheY-like chemotaxis protein
VATVLVVDDEPDLREIMAQVIGDEGYAVLTATNGAEALDYLRRERPDAVVLDLMMPVVDGWAFIETCRDVICAEIPIIVASAIGTGSVAERLQQLGVRVCLTKPFDVGELVQRVAEAVAPAPGAHGLVG